MLTGWSGRKQIVRSHDRIAMIEKRRARGRGMGRPGRRRRRRSRGGRGERRKGRW